MATEHTPGTWKARLAERGDDHCWTISADWEVIATLEGDDDNPIVEANAHLMAGAKGLLEAADELITLADEGAFIDLADVDATPISRRIREAIEKATP